MTMTTQALMPSLGRLRNRYAARLADIPDVAIETFRDCVASAVLDEWRIVAFFGMPEGPSSLRLVAVLADDERGRLGATTSLVGAPYGAVSAACAQAARFESEIVEQCGVVVEGHPAPGPLRRHPPDHAPRGWTLPDVHIGRSWHPRHEQHDSDEVHEVAVGPVHAGIIEPGHFRFRAHGEEVLHLEIALGYQHRGVERALETFGPQRATYVAESIAGDSVIAHASAYCGAIEALARCHKSARAQAIRGIVLELERLANHIGDLGAMAGDVAYQPAAALFGRLRGDCLNMLMTIGGNRYGRGVVRPGGVAFDLSRDMRVELEHRVRRLSREVRPVAELFFGTSSVQARLEGVGVVPGEECLARGFVGPCARSCEVPRDVRHDHPYGVFRYAQIPVATAWAGDVYARALVRWLEVQRSLEFVEEQLQSLPDGELRAPVGALAGSEIVVALEEGWRGEVVHVLVTDDQGRVRRHKVVDPSFRNWPALALAMTGNQISDFPLCNKSFNLSYAGHDL